ncbi:hypothetical protein A2W45_04135 [Candidatus Curtissbacteria bacterium RIFCSPHIGHO2_12_41_11]|uniref:SCP domain-containing protein n=2 Tax=Candidatus Curtissiibacteriota TaxID=1752717 RepID=A0A1F5H5Q5_9BACT|nr:MAG: hypothetical protein A3D07_03155 [Candidatus Curtissbacteria bacterium RIFCSPHIGHO2_02_FULL_42_15]OGD99496.1 MAG: hypothetical protein A2W45_04135 [Candidatus Curtissbacteria bacterium RIFCSPHIGHO2_12_41_11]
MRFSLDPKLSIPKLSKFHKDFIGFFILFAFISISLAFLGLAWILKILQEESFQKAEVIQVQEENSQKPEIPKPKLPGKPQTQIVQNKNSNPLCKGVTEPWKLVPDPGKEGQFIICNSQTGNKMATADELNSALNNYRVAHGFNALRIDGTLCAIAGERAREISQNFSHDGFKAAVERHNLQKSAGENIASGPLTAVQFVEWSWDKSPGHRQNMLSDWTEGCGGVFDRFAVYVFAK